MMYSLVNGRNQRVRTQMYDPVHHSYANFCTEALQKSEMKLDYENEIFLNNLHLIPDPLKKNLADTLITSEMPENVKKQSLNTEMPPKQPSEDVRTDSALAGITNFFSGVFSMLSGAMFRTKSPVHYYDCFDESHQGSPSWRPANDDQDKIGQPDKLSSDDSNPNVSQSDMNKCKTTVSSCEDKLKQVRHLLTPTSQPSNPVWLRKRPKKVFVEPRSVEDSFEDAFTPEDFVTLSNDPYIEYHSPFQYQTEDLCEMDAPKTKLEAPPINETTAIVKDVTEIITKAENSNSNVENEVTLESDKMQLKNTTEEASDEKHQLVSSCEDKLSKLKALLQEKRTKNTKAINPASEPIIEQPRSTKTIPIVKPVDKHYKNPHRMLDKRRKMKMKRSIQDDVIFANEIDNDILVDGSPSTPSTINSSDTSLGDYFDEMKGRFGSLSTTESEDSFQIVFNDCPKRCHKASDCESEDSFIVFEDTDHCYTSNDVFGDSDSDSDISDSGCSTMTCKLSHSLSRTVSNLTDDTLYESSDEVDCAKVEPVIGTKGLLINADKKILRKDLPAKKVHFSTEPPSVKVMRVWAFAARQARAGHWERYALDRDRFKRRIADVDMAVSWVLKPQHRSRVMFQRFMPWWNREKRRELAEKRDIEEQRKEKERVDEEKRLEEEKKNADEKRDEEENTTQHESVPEIGNNSNNQGKIGNFEKANVNLETETKNDKADTKLSSFSNNDEKRGNKCDLKNVSTVITNKNIVKGNLNSESLTDKSEIEKNNNKVSGTGNIKITRKQKGHNLK